MLTEKKLQDLCEQHQLTDYAIAIVKNVRTSNPSRNVRSGKCNVATNYASRKMGCVIKAEASQTELAALYVWDHDRQTHEFYDQPPSIKKVRIGEGGRERASLYTPDFFVIANDFIGWVECKSESWLKARRDAGETEYVIDDAGVWRCPAAERYAASVGLGFRVQSSSETAPILVQNIESLSDYLRPDCPAVSDDDKAKALQLFAPEGWVWLRDLLQNGIGLTADSVFKLIADEFLHVDMHAFPLISEAHRIRVFKTRIQLESANLWLPALLAPSLPGVPQFEMKPGTSLLWDGVAYEILNVGESAVYLHSTEMPLLELSMLSFQELVGTGVIVGTQAITDPRTERASQVLRKATPADFEDARRRYACLHPDRFPEDDVTPASDRAIRKWRSKARAGMEEFGNEFIGLISNIHGRGNRKRRFDEQTIDLMHEVIETEVMSESKVGYFVAWSTLTKRCLEKGLSVPSRRSFENEVRRMKSPEELKKAREGEKAGYGLELPHLTLERDTPRHGGRPFEGAHIDHTEMDLQFVDETFGRNMKKAWLTVMIDAYTRCILAWVILFDPPSYRSCMLVIRDCVRRHHRFPKTIVVDQGSDFKSKYFDLLLAYLNCHKRMRPGSKPRFGNIVERFFGLTNTAFIHALRGNNQALQSPRSMSATHNPLDLAVWNLRAFCEAFEGYLSNCYHATEHPALGVPPAKAMEIGMLQSGLRSHTLITYGRQFVIETMPTTKKGTARIQPNASVKVNRIEYFAPDLAKYSQQDCEVRYDPFNVSLAYVFAGGQWQEVISGYAGMLAGRTEKEIALISTEINELNSRTGIREADRARHLGEFIASLRTREGSLAIETQAARDREQRLTYGNNGLIDTPHDVDDAVSGTSADSNVVPLNATRQKGASVKQMQHDVFENGQRVTFGDFE